MAGHQQARAPGAETQVQDHAAMLREMRQTTCSSRLLAIMGAHGRFDDGAKTFSSQFWLARHRRVIAGAAAVGALIAWRAARPGGRRHAA